MTQNELLQYIPVGLPEDILSCKLHGDFARAVELIDQRLQSEALPRALRCCLMAEREMIVRLPSDYPLTPQQALAKIRSSVPDYTQQEWQQHLAAGQIRWIYVNGEMRIFDRFFESMCKSMPAFGRRAGVLLGGAESTRKGCKGDNRLSHAMEVMRREGSFSNRIRIRASVRIKDECFAPGFVRVHLPIPAACEQQSEIRIEKLYPENGQLSPENAPMRTVCWQEEMQTNHEFTVEYSYRHTARWHDAAEPDAPAEGALPPEAQAALAEQAPQICFTPYIRALTAELTENCATPLEKARRIYDFITLNCKYTYMPAYFSREEIPENCARTFTGDCGVLALLFITLCRCAGIPAQWQSGLVAEPDFIGAHDWARFYIAGRGWLYADVSFGIGAVRAENEERRRFYFGNLDPYRMVANNAFYVPFTVPKQFWSTDPYDNQLGEVETDTCGLRYEQYTRSKEILSFEEEI